MTGLLDFDKLTDENYDTWQFRIKNALVYKGLWSQVSEGKTDDSKDSQALSIIALSCSDSVIHHITECATATNAWEVLKNVFVRKTPAAKVALYKKLINLKCTSISEVNTMVETFTLTVKKLAELKIVIDDEILAIMLLSALPNSCDHFVIAMETRDSLPSLIELKNKLKEEVQRQGNDDNHDDNNSKAMVIQRSNKNLNCFKCGKPGHIAKFCRPRRSAVNTPTSAAVANKVNKAAMYASVFSATVNKDQWLLDSGATVHLCNNKSVLVNAIRSSQEVTIADNTVLKSEYKGTVNVRGKQGLIELNNVLYVPGLKYNFFSANRAVETGHEIILREKGAVVMNNNNDVLATARKSDGLFLMNFGEYKNNSSVVVPEVHNIGQQSQSARLWHQRLGHVNYKTIAKMGEEDLVIGLNGVKFNNKSVCIDCAKCKITEAPYPKEAQNRATEVLGRIHSDICGPMPKQSYGGARYMITFIDDYSRYATVYCIKSKSDAFKSFVEYKELMERQTGNKLKILRTDNGKEYMNSEFDSYLKKCGIKRESSVCYSPSQNGVAERMNRTIVEMCRCMLTTGKMPEASWAEAVSTAAYIRNRVASSSVSTTPFEVLYGKKPTLTHMRTYGCKAVVLSHGQRRKFNQRGELMRFVGYSTTQKGYRLINTQTGVLAISRSVRFFENEMNHQTVSLDDQEYEPPSTSDEPEKVKIELINEADDNDEFSECDADPSVIPEEGAEDSAELRRGPPRAAKAATNEINYIEPRSFQEAANGSSRSAW